MGPHRLLLVASVLAFAPLVACGDDRSIDPEADEDLIEDAILRLDDLPEGFTDSGTDDEESDALDTCNEDVLDIDPDAIDDAKTAEIDDVIFDSAEVNVRASVTAFEDDGDITRILEAIDDDDYVDCAAEQLEDEFGPGQTVQGLEPIDSPFDDDDATIGALALFLEVNSEATSGIVVEVESQQHLVVVDRFGISLQVTAERGQVDDDLVADALEAMVDRLRDGLD